MIQNSNRMKIIVSGSLGNISQPLTKELVQKGHTVTVISSNPEKQKDIEALGATAAIGSLQDTDFITATFSGADSVYCMIPPNHFFAEDPMGYFIGTADNYAQAIKKSGVRRVVLLSSYGADKEKGTGLIVGAHNAEKVFAEIPGINLTIIRPTYFYYNLFGFVNKIRQEGVIAANYGGDKVVMVSPVDIAAVIAEELTSADSHNKIRYVASDEPTGNEIARTLGEAIGRPDLKWVIISDEEMFKHYTTLGLPANIAEGLVEMFASLRTGVMDEDFHRNRPAFGNVKIEDFAKDFAKVYPQM